MSNRIKLKRNSPSNFDATTLPSSLHYGELGLQNVNAQLFVGRCTADNQAAGDAVTTHLPLLSDLSIASNGGIEATTASGATDNSVSLKLDVSDLTTAILTSGDFIAFSDEDQSGDPTRKESIDDIATLFAGAGMTATSAVMNVIGGTGIDANANDISVSAAQTSITSILNSNFVRIGRAADEECIDFNTPNEIRIKAGNISMIKVIDDAQDIVEIGPGSTDVDFKVYNASGASALEMIASTGAVNVAGALTAGSMSIGTLTTTTALRTPAIQFTDGDAAISIANGGAMTFAKGFNVTAGASQFNANVAIKAVGGTILQLNTSTTDVDQGGVLGRLNFSAPDESAGTDAVALSASIEAKAAADFTASVNKTDLIFYTGSSGTATEAMKIGWDNKVHIQGDLQVDGTTTTVESTTVTINDPIFTLGGAGNAGSDDNKDRGIEFKYHTGSAAKVGFFGMDDSDYKFKFIPDASNSSEVFSGSLGSAEFLDVEAATITAATIDCGTF